MKIPKIKNVLMDIDGVILEGDSKYIDGAVEAVKYLKSRYKCLFVTNLTRKRKKTQLEHIRKFGFDISEKEMFTAADACIDYIKTQKSGAKCFLTSPSDIDRDFEEAGLTITHNPDEKVDFVVMGFDRTIDYNKLNACMRLVMKGAQLVAMHEDRTWKADDGIAISLGAFVRAVEYSSGVKATVIGKPSKNFFDAALRQINARPEETVMIGDNLEGDIGGANNAGIASILVRTGNGAGYDESKHTIKPGFVISSIADIERVL